MHRWIDHTAEVELQIDADSPEAVVGEALEAVAELLGQPDEDGETVRHELVVEARDLPGLLAAWLEELVFIAETRGLVGERLVEARLEDTALRAIVQARPGRPRYLIKAVTYHELRFERAGDGWFASAVLDV